jgi:hypothetical protein
MSTKSDLQTLASFEPLRQQLLAAAKKFADDAHPLGQLLGAMIDDVQRATAEPLEIFPVCHHSPAAAVHMIRCLRERPPRVIFMEMCEDLRPLVDKLRDCTLPVALQAFAGQTDAFPKSWAPLSVVAPLTEFSAEYQAIAYALENADTELVFVDRSVDHIFQWMPQEEEELEKHLNKDEEQDQSPATTDEEAGPPPTHGAALGVQLGSVEPTLERFHEFLLRNAQVRSFAEWWDQYVEQAVIAADYDRYRQVLFLVGSLLRRLGRKKEDHESDRKRESFMWTRMKEHLAKRKLRPADALHICGAIHSVSDVAEYGAGSAARWDIPARTKTPWLYGLIPSSHAAIDWQFHFPPGTVTLAEATWHKTQRALDVKPFALAKAGSTAKTKKPAAKRPAVPVGTAVPATPATPADILNYLTRPPALTGEDEEQLLGWCVGVVELARNNGYLATTADSIAVYHTSLMLAQLRNRRHPTPYDFRDAAITCLEKDRTPKKRNIQRLCEVLLGGDRRGRVGFDSLPPLAQDVYTRLDVIRKVDKNFDLKSSKLSRALLDLKTHPELLPVSDLLWKLRYLFTKNHRADVLRPIMGEKALGKVPVQESWEVGIGRNQTPLIHLGYEGVTVEHVLERRLKADAFSADATPVTALAAAEDCILYLQSPRLTEEIGDHAVGLLVQETGAQSAPEVFERMRRLVHYFRSTPTGLPEWAKRFVTTGYSHYATLLPTAFADRGTAPDQVAGMLAFVFNLESLALSLGCNRSQLLIAVQQAAPGVQDPDKLGLLWSAEWVLGLRKVEQIREFFDHLFENRLALAAFPGYVSGFLLALKFTSLVVRLVVELLSRAFERLPDSVLMPWMPGLIMALRGHVDSVLPNLMKEASNCFPPTLAALRDWRPPWQAVPAATAPTVEAKAASVERGPEEAAVFALLAEHPATTDALARLLGVEPAWSRAAPAVAGAAPTPASGSVSPDEKGAHGLLAEHPQTAAALGALLGP